MDNDHCENVNKLESAGKTYYIIGAVLLHSSKMNNMDLSQYLGHDL
ncbi:hypothetical protein [Enterococcus casseliflavus]